MTSGLNTASIICFCLAAFFLVTSIVVFFSLKIQNVFSEVYKKGNIRKSKSAGRRQQKTEIYHLNISEVKQEKPPAILPEGELQTGIEDEAATVLDSGELAEDGLIGVFEPGTDTLNADEPCAVFEDAVQVPSIPHTGVQYRAGFDADSVKPSRLEGTTNIQFSAAEDNTKVQSSFPDSEEATTAADENTYEDLFESGDDTVTAPFDGTDRIEVIKEILLFNENSILHQLVD